MDAVIDLDLSRRPGQQTLALGLATALLALVSVVLVMPAVSEAPRHFGRVSSSTVSAAAPNPTQAEPAGINAKHVVDTVRHRMRPVAGRDGVLVASDPRYRARFDRAGFVLAAGSTGPGLRVSTRGLRLGDEALPLRIGTWHGRENVARRSLRDRVTERVTAAHGRLQWDVLLARPLPGAGDLRVTARLDGAAGAPIRLRHPDAWRWPIGSNVSVRMGEMVLKDASGAELYRTLPSVERSTLTLTVPGDVLVGARYPLTLDPSVTAETAMGNTLQPDDQAAPAVAWNGTNFLVVWEDNRSGSSYDIYATRLNSSGVVLDGSGLPISAGANDESEPSVAWNGTNFLVVWTDNRGTSNDIYGARVSGAGLVLDAGGFPISTASGQQSSAALAWSGTNFFVVWMDSRNGGSDVYGTRVNSAGTVLDGGGVAVSLATGAKFDPVVAWSGTNFLVAWSDDRNPTADIYGRLVNTNGVALGSADIGIATGAGDQQQPAVAWNGTNFLVVWGHGAGVGGTDIHGRLVNGSGVVQGASDILASTATGSQSSPSVAWNGTNFLVAWVDSRNGANDIYGTTVNGSGAVLDSGGIPMSTAADDQGEPVVVANGATFLATWSDLRNGNDGDIYGARLSGSGSVLDATGFAISTAVNDQALPSVVWNGTNFLIVWQEIGSSGSLIYGARASDTGVLLDPTGIRISPKGFDAYNPSVAWSGTTFLVAWVDIASGAGDIHGARVTGAGTVLDPFGVVISDASGQQLAPKVSGNGTSFLVVWQDERNGNPDVYGARVDTSGVVQEPGGISISYLDTPQEAPDVSSDGTNWLVVWQDRRNGVSYDIFGARVLSSGAVLDPTLPPPLVGGGVDLAQIGADQIAPSLAWNGSRYLLIWEDHANGNADVYGTRVSTVGELSSESTPRTICSTPAFQRLPQVAASGGIFLVFWHDDRNGGDDLYASRVTDAGAVQDAPSGFAVANSTQPLGGAITSGPAGKWGVVYDRFVTNHTRVFLRRVSPK